MTETKDLLDTEITFQGQQRRVGDLSVRDFLTVAFPDGPVLKAMRNSIAFYGPKDHPLRIKRTARNCGLTARRDKSTGQWMIYDRTTLAGLEHLDTAQAVAFLREFEGVVQRGDLDEVVDEARNDAWRECMYDADIPEGDQAQWRTQQDADLDVIT